jgi:KamA family protein
MPRSLPVLKQRPRPKFRPLDRRALHTLPQLAPLGEAAIRAMHAGSYVLPFRVNEYVVEELIDWQRVPDDPIFRLTFPQRGMLSEHDQRTMETLLARGASEPQLRAAAHRIQARLNPHPAGQRELNVPTLDGRPVHGIQHKYRETVLLFPRQGQTCHAFCAYCFRWPQFVGIEDLRFATDDMTTVVRYLERHPEVTDVLVTGGDPLLMRTAVLRRYLEPLLSASLPHLTAIRIGTKATAYWPHRFVEDDDADDLLRLFEQVVASGRTLALMAHSSHPRELETVVSLRALQRIRETGAVVRCQAPLIRGVNDDPEVWAELWRRQVRLGAIPYYVFVERDTGAREYFEVPLVRAWSIVREARSMVSGLARTVRGPSMSATPGKVAIDGVANVAGEKVFALRFLQARDPRWVDRPFHAAYSPNATWLDQLRPAFGEKHFFWEPGMRALQERSCRQHPPADTTEPDDVVDRAS